MKIRSLNNATTLFQGDICSVIVDPWIVGDLYEDSWSPVVEMADLGFLKPVDHVIISHIHEDHWDIETIKHFGPDTTFHIPTMKVNNVIERSLIENGYKHVKFHELGERANLNDEFSFRFIAPLNAFGQELGRYDEGYETDATHIDTGIILTYRPEDRHHLLLCDNSPYDTEMLADIVEEEIETLWYPFNSYAQDYPLCYENFTFDERVSRSAKMNARNLKAVCDAIATVNAKYCFPHSSDFVLNGKRKDDFERFVDQKFMDRKAAADLMRSELKARNLPCEANYCTAADEIDLSDGTLKIERGRFETRPVKGRNLVYSDPRGLDLKHALQEATRNMFARVERFGIKLGDSTNDWVLEINSGDFFGRIRYLERDVIFDDEPHDRKLLRMSINRDLLEKVLSRDLHWNNLQIGFHLDWIREPEEFNDDVYKAINFLHV